MSDSVLVDPMHVDKENARPTAVLIEVQSKPLNHSILSNKSQQFELSNHNRTPETSQQRKIHNDPLSAAINPLLPSQSALHAAASAQLKQVPPPSASIPAFLAPEPPAAWKIDPREIKRLDHLPPLGTGAYGTVYRASWHGLPVAVKELDASINDPQAYAEFKAEMDVWSSLRYPAIVSLYGAFTSPRLCLVMQYCKNGALSDHLHGDPNCEFGFDSILRIASQVASGLQYLHSRGVVHRDIKSFNVLLDEEGNARLSDFGLSVSMRREVLSRASSRATLTTASTVASLNASPVRMRQTNRLSAPPSPFSPHQVNVTPKREKHSLKRTPPAAALHSLPPQHSPSHIRTPRKADIMAKIPSPAALPVSNCESENEGGALSNPADPYEHPGCGLPGSTLGPLGTYGFMSPELFTHGRYSPASDSYAFGCYLWEMVARAVPFGATPPIEIATAVVHGLRPPLPPHLPFEYRELIRACWSQRPEDRPTMEEILARIGKMQQEIAQEIQWEMQREKTGAAQAGTRRGNGAPPRPGKWLEASWVNAYEVSQPYCLFDGPPSTPTALDAAKYHSNPYFQQADDQCDDEEELNGDAGDAEDETALRAIASNEAHLAEFSDNPAYFELTPEDLAKLTASERAYYHAQRAIDMEEQREYIRAKLQQERLQAKKDLKRRQAQKPTASQDNASAGDEDASEDSDQPRYFQHAYSRPQSRPEERAGRLMLTSQDEMEQSAPEDANGKSYFVPAHLLDSSQALSDTLNHSHTDGHNESAYWEQVRQEEERLMHLQNQAEASIVAQRIKQQQQMELEQKQEEHQREARKQLQDAAWAASSGKEQETSQQSKKLRQILVAAKPKSPSEGDDSSSSLQTYQSGTVPSKLSKQKRNEKLLARIAKMLEEDVDSCEEEDQQSPKSTIHLKSKVHDLPSKPMTPLNPLTQRQLDELMLSPVDAIIDSVLHETKDSTEQPRNLTPVIPLIPTCSTVFNDGTLPIASPLTLSNDSTSDASGAVSDSPKLWAEKVVKKPEATPSWAPAASDSLVPAVPTVHNATVGNAATVFVIPQPQILTLRPFDPSADSSTVSRPSVTPVRGENLLKQEHARVDSTATTAVNTPSAVVFHATSRSSTPPQSSTDVAATTTSPTSFSQQKDASMPFMSPAQVADGALSPSSNCSLPLSCTPSGKEHTLSSLSPISRIDELSTPQHVSSTPMVSSETKLLSSFHSAAVPAPAITIVSTPRLQEEKQFDELSLPSPLPPLAETMFLAPSQPIHFMHQLQQQAKFHSAAQALTLAANQHHAAAKADASGEAGDAETMIVGKEASISPTLNSTRFLTPLIGTQNRSEALLSAMNRSSNAPIHTSASVASSARGVDQEECKQPMPLPSHSIADDIPANNGPLAIVPNAGNNGKNGNLDLEVKQQKACCVIM